MRASSLDTQLLGSLFNSVPDAVVVADGETGRVVIWNEASERIFGYTQNEALGMPVADLVRDTDADDGFDIRHYAEVHPDVSVDSRRTMELPAVRKSGEAIDIEISVGPLRGPSDSPLAVAIVRDISERKRVENQNRRRAEELSEANAALKEQAETDGLTGLANRGRAMHMLDKFALLARRHDRPLALAFLDIDRFKLVNDRYGHNAGDEVLRRFGELLVKSFRGEDIVARWGGEEFIIGMFGMTKSHGADRVTAFARLFKEERFAGPDGTAFQVTCSGGVAEYPKDSADMTELIDIADKALYQAKESGRDRVISTA